MLTELNVITLHAALSWIFIIFFCGAKLFDVISINHASRKIFARSNFGKQVMQSEHTHCSTDSSWMDQGREWALWIW